MRQRQNQKEAMAVDISNDNSQQRAFVFTRNKTDEKLSLSLKSELIKSKLMLVNTVVRLVKNRRNEMKIEISSQSLPSIK